MLKDVQTIEREFGNLIKIEDNFPKYVVSLDKIKTANSYKGIIHLTLREFLSLEF